MSYEIVKQEFKGTQVLAFFKLKKDGTRQNDFPFLAFGRSKAKLILEYFDKIKSFVEETNQSVNQ